MKKMQDKKEKQDVAYKDQSSTITTLPPRIIGSIAEEVAKTLASRIPGMLPGPRRQKPRMKKKKKIEHAIFLDTSAIIDGRIFDVFTLGMVGGPIVLPHSILLELKHIADSQNLVKRERGKNGLKYLDQLKKTKGVKVLVLPESEEIKYTDKEIKEVDERLIRIAKSMKGKIITCDYNLEKKASIQGITAINVNALAHALKVRAVPGEALHVAVLHKGKDITQGVGYLDDGTMLVIEKGSDDIGKTVDVVVSRVIQTAAGRILFAKKI